MNVPEEWRHWIALSSKEHHQVTLFDEQEISIDAVPINSHSSTLTRYDTSIEAIPQQTAWNEPADKKRTIQQETATEEPSKRTKIRSGLRSNQPMERFGFFVISNRVAISLLIKLNPSFDRNRFVIPYSKPAVLDSMTEMRLLLSNQGVPLPNGMSSEREVLTQVETERLKIWMNLAIAPHLKDCVAFPEGFDDMDAQKILIESNLLVYDREWCLEGEHRMKTFSEVKTFIRLNGLKNLVVSEGMDKVMVYIACDSSWGPSPLTWQNEVKEVNEVVIPSTVLPTKVKSVVRRTEFDTAPSRPLDEQPLLQRVHWKRKSQSLPPQALRPDEIEPQSQNVSSSEQIFFYQTVGKLRHSSAVNFKWGNQIGCRANLGRLYFDSFALQEVQFKVGDFVMQELHDGDKHLFKVVSAFQALQSFHGKWEKKHGVSLLQKRGHAYIEIAPLLQLPIKDRRGSRQVYLKAADLYHMGNVQALPCALFEESTFTHAVVEVDPPYSENLDCFVCSRLNNSKASLSLHQKRLLTETCPLMLQNFAYGEWARSLDAKAIQLIHHDRVWKHSHHGSIPIADTEYSSDDSDSCQDNDNIEGTTLVNSAIFDPADLRQLQLAHARLKTTPLRKNTPLPSISITGAIVNVAKNKKQKDDDCFFATCMKLNALLDDPSIQGNSQLVAAAVQFQHLLLMEIRQHQPLDQFYTNHTESIMPTTSIKLTQEIRKVALTMIKIHRLDDLQAQVVVEAVSEPDINTVVVAPCGYGKSLCFALPALYRRGITLVIEPLRVLVENQYSTFVKHARPGDFDVHRLLARDNANGNKIHYQVLDELLNTSPTTLKSKCTLIFSTPELIECNIVAISRLHQAGVLTSIVFDEFDVQTEAYDDYREVYVELLPRLRETCPSASFMFLSATASRNALLSIVPKVALPEQKMKLFLSHRPLSDSLRFRVERKENLKQVAERIKVIMGLGNWKQRPKSLCYCLTRTECTKMATELNLYGIKAVAFHSENNRDGSAIGILEEFKKEDGDISVLCCTTVLGRGFHHPKIRFIFHANIPTSLSGYIQEAGRGGRDGQPATCVLFYRNQDISKVESVMRRDGKKLPLARRLLLDDDMSAMAAYCLSDNCRYNHLADYAYPKSHAMEQLCHPKAQCDNCLKKEAASGVAKFNLQAFIVDFLSFVDGDMRKHPTSALSSKHIEYLLRKTVGREPPNWIIPLLRRHVDVSGYSTLESIGDVATNSPANDMLRHLVISRILGFDNGLKEYKRGANFESFQNQLRMGGVTMSLEYIPLTILHGDAQLHCTSDKIIDENCVQLDIDGDRQALKMLRLRGSVDATDKQQKVDLRILGDNMALDPIMFDLPFLLRFEVSRILGLASEKEEVFTQAKRDQIAAMIQGRTWIGDLGADLRLSFLEAAHQLVGSTATMSSYVDNVHKTLKTSLYFQADLEPSGHLRLGCPRVETDRRIFRKFGFDRFLHIEVRAQMIPKCFEEGLFLFGRSWRFLWCKTTHSPQCYIFFAEIGIGIVREKEISVEDVRNWCIPSELNRELSIAKEFKRLKLSFSKTTASGILPHCCIDIIDDIVNINGSDKSSANMTDGCGLISKDGIDFVWRAYHGNFTESDAELKGIAYNCPCSSFQGRIGGFKGMWVLDTSLGCSGEGIKLHCRRSQLKFNSPMRSLTKESWEQLGLLLNMSVIDDSYDTVDVNSWDVTPERGRLSIRAIQLLEERGAAYDILEQCAKVGTKDLENFAADKTALPMLVFQRYRHTVGGHNENLLFKMQAASVNPNEPVFAKLRASEMTCNIEAMRLKGQYPLRDCYNLRMIPDHLGLLHENEVFIAIGNGLSSSLGQATHAVLMRNPSYFAGDLRKLSIVTYETLVTRALDDPKRQCSTFYWPLINSTGGAVVLSTKGERSEAHKMSGGDYDGDKAWVCWFDKLVDPIRIQSAEDTDFFEDALDNTGDVPNASSKDATTTDRIRYAWHFRFHQSQLGFLANTLDKTIDRFGFDSVEGKEVGKQSFLQVDHPYELCKIKEEVKDQLKHINEPHWKGTTAFSSRSIQTFIGRLYDFVGGNIAKAIAFDTQQERRPSQHIERFITKSFNLNEVGNLEKLSSLRNTMKSAVEQYNVELAKIIKRAERLHKTDKVRFDQHIRTWKECYLQHQKGILFHSKDDTENMAAAAVLYEQTYQLAKSNAHRLGTSVEQISKVGSSDFAWKVASDKLCTIVAREENHGVLPTVLTKDAERLMFGKVKR